MQNRKNLQAKPLVQIEIQIKLLDKQSCGVLWNIWCPGWHHRNQMWLIQKQVLTWASFLVCIQYKSHFTLADIRLITVDTNVLAIMSIGTSIWTCKETLPRLTIFSQSQSEPCGFNHSAKLSYVFQYNSIKQFRQYASFSFSAESKNEIVEKSC